MKNKNISLLLIVLFISNTIIAQDFQGIATYKSQRKLSIKLDSTQMDSDRHQDMMAMLQKQFEKTYILSFNKEESIYKEDEKLEAPQPAGMQLMIVNTGGSDLLYKNTKENRYTNQNESFSKLFLIKDTLQGHDWELSGETKFIGDYECRKATTTRQVRVVQGGVSINGDKDLSENENEEPELREQIVTAWYAPEIPINHGPSNYEGLPGLILEVNDGTTTMICSKIVINPSKKITIVEPKKGKVLNQDEYDAIMEKKMREMEEKMRDNWSGDGDGERVEIRIGG